jgi:pimeloyl-[acyl-carrier protein] methyl ester esterase
MNTIVFWHGWGLGPQVWDKLIEQLSPSLSTRYELVVQPLPGYAPSQKPIVHSSLDELLNDLMKDLTPPVVLCGWSLGAILALLAASHFPTQVDKLILISATPNFMKRADWSDGVAQNLIDKLGTGIRMDPIATIKRFITILNQNDINARDIAKNLSGASSAPVSCLENGLDLLKHTDLRSIVPDIRQPALLLHGALDTLMPLSAAQWLNKHIPNSELFVLEDASHAPFLSNSEQSAKIIVDFLNAHP